MARKRHAPPGPLGSVTLERAVRLVRLLRFIGAAPQPRTTLTRKLRLGVRGFYRDLEILRAAGIDVLLGAGRYGLREPLPEAIDKLPFPDPCLSFGEARKLGRGRSPAHKKIQATLEVLEK